MAISIPEELGIEQSEKHSASIRLEPDGLSFFCHNTESEDKGIFSQRVTFNPSQSYAAALKECFFDNECLTWKYKHFSIVVSNTPYVLVPEKYYDDSRKREIFSFNFTKAPASGYVVDNHLPEGTVLLFSLPEDVYAFCSRSFEMPEFLHPATLLLHQWAKQSRNSLYKQAFVQVAEQHIEIACFAPQGKLLLANSFEAKAVRDIVFYILYVWKQESFDQIDDRLYISGNDARCEEIRRILGVYIRNIQPLPMPGEGYFKEETEDSGDIPMDIIYLFSQTSLMQ